MRRELIMLFDNGSHQCLMFDDLVSGDGVQSNQFRWSCPSTFRCRT